MFIYMIVASETAPASGGEKFNRFYNFESLKFLLVFCMVQDTM